MKVAFQEIVSHLGEFVSPARLKRLTDVSQARTNNLVLVLDRVNNDHNISAILRSADAFGVNQIHIVESNFDNSSGVSKGSERWLSIQSHSSDKEVIDLLNSTGHKIVVLQPKYHPTQNSPEPKHSALEQSTCKQSVPVFNLPFHDKLALVFGNENLGVSKEFQNMATYYSYIPMLGFVESLNVSVACAITLFCSLISSANAQRQVPALGIEEQQQLLASWLVKDINNGEAVLERLLTPTTPVAK